MRKEKFKLTHSEASALKNIISRLLMEQAKTPDELLAKTLLVITLKNLHNKCLIKFEKTKIINLPITEALALFIVMGKKKLDWFSPFESTVALPIIERLDKSIKHIIR